MYPKTDDRAYDELQKMMEAGRDLTDKVILTVFSSAGFRVRRGSFFKPTAVEGTPGLLLVHHPGGLQSGGAYPKWATPC